jgi:hypothetical protein
LDDGDFDVVLAQRGVHDASVKSFIDYDEQLIGVRARLCSDHRRELIVHELVHAMVEDAGIVQDDRVEQIVTAMAPRLNSLLDGGLLSVLRETCP